MPEGVYHSRLDEDTEELFDSIFGVNVTMSPTLEEKYVPVLDSKDTDDLVVEEIINDVISVVGEEALRMMTRGHDVGDPEEIEVHIDDAFDQHQELADAILRVPDGKKDNMMHLVYQNLFGAPTFAQGDRIMTRYLDVENMDCFYGEDNFLFKDQSDLVVSKVIGDLVKIKNKKMNKTTESYYLSSWFIKCGTGAVVPSKIQPLASSESYTVTMSKADIERCAAVQHRFQDRSQDLMMNKLQGDILVFVKIGDRIQNRADGIVYTVSAVSYNNNTLQISGAENLGNWHPFTDFKPLYCAAWTRDYKEIRTGANVQATASACQAAMNAFGWTATKPEEFTPQYYQYRRAMMDTTFLVVATDTGSKVFLKALSGALFDIIGPDFVYSALGDYFVFNRENYAKDLMEKSAEEATTGYDGHGNLIYLKTGKLVNPEFKKIDDAEAKKKQHDKEKGPYNLDSYLDKLVRIKWKGWKHDGDPGLVVSVDNEYGHITVKFNENRTDSEFYFRKSVGEEKHLVIIGNKIFSDEA